MVKQLAKWSTLMRSPRLAAVHSIECLIKEQTDRPGKVYPGWTVLVECRVIIKEREEVNDDESETAERYLNSESATICRKVQTATAYRVGSVSRH